jgi:DNA polymerase IV (DinB-like DNA polymerase)
MGIETAGDLATADPDELTEALGSRGRAIYRHARGVDDREVEPVGKPKSLSSEKALSTTEDKVTKRELISRLAAEVAERARSEGALYKTIGVKVVTPPFDVNTRARSLSGPVDEPELVKEVALELLREFADAEVRKLGVRVSNLEFADADQVSLTGWTNAEETGGAGGKPGQRRRESPGTRGQTTFGDFSADSS